MLVTEDNDALPYVRKLEPQLREPNRESATSAQCSTSVIYSTHSRVSETGSAQ